jgi:anti-sigma B factor antagonist
MEEFLLMVRDEPGHVLVTVAGEIDIGTVPQLRGQLATLTDSGRLLVVDLGQVSYIGAAGLGVLAGAAAQARASGGSLHVVAPDLIRRLFALTGLDQQIPVAGTLAEAVDDLRPGWDMPVNGNSSHTASPDPS